MAEVKFTDSIDIKRPEKKNNAGHGVRKNDKLETDIRNNIMKGVEHAGGKYVKFDDVDHTEGMLVGGVKKSGKHYFAVMDRDKVIKYISPNEHFSIIRDIPASLYILDYVYKHDSEYLYDLAFNYFENDKADLFTNCYIKKKNHK